MSRLLLKFINVIADLCLQLTVFLGAWKPQASLVYYLVRLARYNEDAISCVLILLVCALHVNILLFCSLL